MTQTPKTTLKFASFLGDNAFGFYSRVVEYVADTTGIGAELVRDLSPEEQDRRVNDGDIQAVFTCGLPYVRKADLDPPLLRLLAAPVMAAPRYQGRPVYFSDVIVRADSPVQTLVELRHTTFAYNEVHSLSGYVLPCYYLWQLDQPQPFFADTLRSGSHTESMAWVESGQVTAAAIDSVVLDMELTRCLRRADVFRVIDSIGPMPAPPVAASPRMSAADFFPVQQALLAMHTTHAGQIILQTAGVRRFAPITDSNYNSIRRIVTALQQAGITELW